MNTKRAMKITTEILIAKGAKQLALLWQIFFE